MLKEIPQVTGLPFLGSFPEFRNARLDLLQRVRAECGDVGAFRIGPRTLILVSSAELTREILVKRPKEFSKSPTMRRALRPALGDGLLTSEGDHHKRQRKLMAPVFQHKNIGIYAGLMATCAEEAVRSWPDGGVIDVSEKMTELTLRIVGQALFGADLLGEARELGHAVQEIIEYGNDQMGALFHIPLEWPTPDNERFRAALERVNATLGRMIQECRATAHERTDLLALLVRARDEEDGDEMDDNQVRDESLTLFAAGHETTALALGWAWHLLTHHPEVYARLQAEARGALQGRSPTLADLENLPYTRQVFKETLRLYPPAYIMGRTVLSDMELGGYPIKAGSVLFVSPYVMHHRPDYFPQPEAFDPDRFSPDREAQIPDDAYLPFGAGPRVCIGNHFAMLEGQLLLAAIAQRVTFEALPDQDERQPGIQVVEPGPQITLRPREGIRVRVRAAPAP